MKGTETPGSPTFRAVGSNRFIQIHRVRGRANESPNPTRCVLISAMVAGMDPWQMVEAMPADSAVFLLTDGIRKPAPPPGGLRLGHVMDHAPSADIPPVHLFNHGDLCQALLALRECTEFEFYWLIHHEVHFSGSWRALLEELQADGADFISPLLRTLPEDPDWFWWSTLEVPPGQGPLMPAERFAALSTFLGISAAAIDSVSAGIRAGWSGHCECLFPTLVNKAGLKLEDPGGHGRLTAPARKDRIYRSDTFSPGGPPIHLEGFLHYPVSRASAAPSRYRFQAPTGKSPSILYFSPAGRAAEDLIGETAARFLAAAADFRIVCYEDMELPDCAARGAVRDTGQKWELARKNLDPSSLGAYDYIFVWDDDIGIGDFDPQRFVRIMEANRLSMAQPSLRSPHPICHPITVQQPSPLPAGLYSRVGRLTNFVEIMVPVFTRAAWAEFHSYLSEASSLGWGLDYIPLPRKGIVDVMHVVHTRACKDHGPEAYAEMSSFLEREALLEYRHQNTGYLLDL